jgi:fatty acid desaturase
MDNRKIDTYVALPWHKRWYSYNKQKIPMIFTLIGAFFFTAFLDFEVQGTKIKLESHIAALNKLTNTAQNNIAAFLLFVMYLVALIQLFNSFTFAKNRSPIVLYIMTVLTGLQVFVAFSYRKVFFDELMRRPDSYDISKATELAYTVSIIGAILFVIATVFAWIYVDWKYVKEKDE